VGGVCVADTSCPASLVPEVVYQQNGGDLQSALTLMNGREYWQGLTDAAPPSADTKTVLVDLATKVTSTFPHVLGWGGCSGDPATCVVYPQDGSAPTLFTGVHLDTATQTWVADASYPLPAGYTTFARDEPAAGGWLVWNADQHTLATWDPPSGALDPLFVVAGQSPLGGVVEGEGQPKTIVTLGNTSAAATLSTAPLQKGASFTPLLTVPGGVLSMAIPVPIGDGEWFVVHDAPGETSGLHVWRVDANGQTELGTLDDPLVGPAAARYRLGSPALEGGTRAKSATCRADTCRTGAVDFATASVAEIGSTKVAGTTNLAGGGARWLACDTAEVLTSEVVGTTLKVYRVWVPANAK
jgi:hypothetical protein